MDAICTYKYLFKSMTLIVERNFQIEINPVTSMIFLFFADPGTPSQRGLNENSNGLLRKDGLPKANGF